MALWGCSAPRNPWIYYKPPTTVEPGAAAAEKHDDRPVVVIGRFADPTKAPTYSSGVGRMMSDALGRALLHEGTYDVWINPQLSRAVEAAINLPTAQRTEALGELESEHPDVDFVITGKVTDFYHGSDLPPDVARWGLFGRRNEAVAAIDMRIVDMRTHRVVGADHLKGTAGAGLRNRPSGDIYGGVALDSYVFWSTPLGRASRSVITDAVDRTVHVVPETEPGSRAARMKLAAQTSADAIEGADEANELTEHDRSPRAAAQRSGPYEPGRAATSSSLQSPGARPNPSVRDNPRISQIIGRRRVRISGGSDHGVAIGRDYLLVMKDGGDEMVVRDAHTREPLRVRVTSASRNSAIGLLRGEPPVELNIRGARLQD